MEFEPKSEVESEYDEEENPEGLQQKRPLDDEDLRLFLIRRTVLQMLRDRGYLVSDMELAMSREDFRETFGSNVERHQLDTVRELRANPDEKISVFFPDEFKVGVAVIKRYAETMKENKVKAAILVLQRKLTMYGRQSISETSTKYRMEVFQETELLVNVKHSILVPEFVVLTDDERRTILDRFSATEAQLPRLLVDDPISRYYGLTKGQMVKIVRRGKRPNGDDDLSYRVLV